MPGAVTGGCMCARVRYTAKLGDDEAYRCHCRMCQRASGNVSLALKNLKAAAVRWERKPDYYSSSPIARWGYCRECGTSLAFQYLEGTDKMDLTVASFYDPSLFRPAHHFGAEIMHRDWVETSGLPETRSDDYEPLNQRWKNAVGKFPD